MPSPGSDPIFLVGMMGAGKTVVGAALADALGRPFVDLDRAIEAAAGMSVAALFAAEGEHSFRERESRVLGSIDMTDAIVATGGGVVTRPENVDLLLSRGRVVYLRTKSSTILSRLAKQKGGLSSRPLLRHAPEQALGGLWEQRRSAYERAHHHVDTDARTVAELVDVIRQVLAL